MANPKKRSSISQQGLRLGEEEPVSDTSTAEAAYVIEGLNAPVLVGYRFKFPKQTDDWELIASKIYFNRTTLGFYPEELETNQIRHAFQGTGETFEYDIVEEPKNYQEFEFFDSDTNFVFFSKDELEPMLMLLELDPTRQIVVSGCRIQFGKVAHQRTGDDKIDESRLYFTLKIEIKPGTDQTQGRTRGEEESFPVGILAVGQPCPPKWMPGALADALLRLGVLTDPDDFHKVSNNWLRFTVDKYT